ncbi:hypothetical protein C8Q78DRAFT_963658 [Trametes maxima]|nr:hypothetical protein C8Q78DRAFT_963658 [Trametes maxima]
MSAQYDLPRPANHHLRPMDTTRLHMASKSTSHHSSHPSERTARRVPVPSASMPQTSSWLSDVGDFNTSPSHNYLGVSDAMLSSGSFHFAPSRRPSEPVVQAPLLREPRPPREKVSLHVNTIGLPSSPAPRQRPSPSPDRRPETSDGQQPKPSRNVLRRRPSARSNPSTPTANQFQIVADGSVPALHSAPPKPQPRSERITHSFSVRPTTAPATDRSASFPRKMSMSAIPSSKSAQCPGGLTPAGAVALAYKQQEQRREELAETASFNDAYRPSSASPASLPMRRINVEVLEPEFETEEEEGGEPYYTVFGSSTGRVVAVGSPDDDWHVGGGWETRATVAVAHKTTSGSRSLSRKVSGSFKRVAESMKREREVRDPLARTRGMDDWAPYDGQRSTNGRDSPSRSKGSRKPQPLDTNLERRSSPRASPAPKSGVSPAGSSPSPLEDGRSVSRASHAKGKDRPGEVSPGGMWSKLMKRISSTGALREKYNHGDEPPPPVPALPQHIPKSATSRTTMEISHTANGEVSENGVLLRRFMQSRSSLSGVRPSTASSKPSSSSSHPSSGTGTAGRPSTGNTTKSRASLSQRPSTNTRSSSPVSSEIASSGFFNHNRTPSTRSSFSSFGEELPPMPKNLGQYIVPPGELSRMAKTAEHGTPTPSVRTRKTSRSQSAPVNERVQRSPDDNAVPSLPLPPRRATHEGATSPFSASFSTDDVSICNPSGSSHAPPLAEFGMKEPPPRPKRSSRRMPPPNVSVPPRSQSMSATMPRSPATPRGPPAVRVDVDLSRSPSTGALSYASTARQVSAVSPSRHSPSQSSVTSPSSAVSQKRSPLTFRELESPRQKLSEKEKAAKWEDLLERSARAGGTLRVGDSGLLSENAEPDGASVFGGDA